jgi:hypothetical protein
MNEDFDALSYFAMAEYNQLRAQAFDLFDRCLAENNPAPIIAFIEKQVTDDPPHLPLLRDFAEGLHQRLLSLRVYHYDVRNHVIKAFTEDYQIDLTPLLPANAASQYHEINVRQVVEYSREHGKDLTEKDLLMLGKLLETSIKAAARLQVEIKMTLDLQTMVNDWLSALNATVGRRYWSEADSASRQNIQ